MIKELGKGEERRYANTRLQMKSNGCVGDVCVAAPLDLSINQVIVKSFKRKVFVRAAIHIVIYRL